MFYPDLDNKLAFIGYARPLIGAIPPTAEMQSRLYASVISGMTSLPESQTMKKVQLFLLALQPFVRNTYYFDAPPTVSSVRTIITSPSLSRLLLPQTVAKSLKRKAVEFPTFCQPHILINWIPYLDKLATLVGCKVSIYDVWNKYVGPTRESYDYYYYYYYSPLAFMPFATNRPLLLWKVLTGPFCTFQYRLFGPGSQFKAANRVVMSLPRMHQLTELAVMTCLSFYSFVGALCTGSESLFNATTFL